MSEQGPSNRKNELEIEKLELEVKDLKRSNRSKFFSNFHYWFNAFCTLCIVGITYLVLWKKGAFEIEEQRLAVVTDSLRHQEKILTSELNLIEERKDSLSIIVNSLSNQLQTGNENQRKKEKEYNDQISKSKEENRSENELTPIRIILNSIANIPDELKVNIDDETYQTFINKLQSAKSNKKINNLIENFLKDKNINAKSKTDVIIAYYLATNDGEWKRKLYEYLNEDLINHYSDKLQWKSFSSQQLHENSKFLIASILRIKNISKENQKGLNEILSNIIGNYSEGNKSIVEDSLMDPSSDDYDSFIDFLKAYRCVNIDFNEQPKRTKPISNYIAKWDVLYIAFLAISVQQEIEKDNVKGYLTSLRLVRFPRDGKLIPNSLMKNISRDYSTDKNAWVNWSNDYKIIINRLLEPELRTYRRNEDLFKNDFKIN
jgi:hypothetical protein